MRNGLSAAREHSLASFRLNFFPLPRPRVGCELQAGFGALVEPVEGLLHCVMVVGAVEASSLGKIEGEAAAIGTVEGASMMTVLVVVAVRPF